ncbi:MAG: efflux RND transporter periplasmic adaptor subunit [Clostridia bacterium]|nr:efflux RND transporter periplasmic adaptor subunit [Clostridia bacterium]
MDKFRSISNKRKYTLIGAFAAAITIVIILMAVRANSEETEAATYENYEVTTVSMQQTLTAAGELAASESETVDFSTSKTFLAMCVEEGETVTEGQNLIEYSDGSYEEAPVSGIVTEIIAPETGTVADSENTMTIGEIDTLALEITVPEDEINEISKGDEATIIVNADTNKVFYGTITGKKEMSTTLISEKASEETTETEGKTDETGEGSRAEDPFGSESSTAYYTVSLKLKNDGSLKTGMSASCTITISDRSDVLAVPVEAVKFTSKGNAYVLAAEDSDTERIYVTTGESDAENVEITDGLEEGDIIRIER